MCLFFCYDAKIFCWGLFKVIWKTKPHLSPLSVQFMAPLQFLNVPKRISASLYKVKKKQIQPTGNLGYQICISNLTGHLDSRISAISIPNSEQKTQNKPQHFGLVKLYFGHYYNNQKCMSHTLFRRNTGLIKKCFYVWTLSGWSESLQIQHRSSHLH